MDFIRPIEPDRLRPPVQPVPRTGRRRDDEREPDGQGGRRRGSQTPKGDRRVNPEDGHIDVLA